MTDFLLDFITAYGVISLVGTMLLILWLELEFG